MTRRNAEELRRAFDASFAAPPDPVAASPEQLLAVRVGEEGFAVRMRDLAAVLPLPRTTPLPGRAPELLGLAAVRGTLVATFRADALLGLARSSSAPRWLLTCAADPSVGLAFDVLDDRLTVSPHEVHSRGPGAGRHAPEIVLTEAFSLGLLDLGAIAAAVAERAASQPARRDD